MLKTIKTRINPVKFICLSIFFINLFVAFTGRAMERSYRDQWATHLEKSAQRFLTFREIVTVGSKAKVDFPKYTQQDLDVFLKSEFGGVYDGYHPLIDEYIRFFQSRPTQQLQLWLTLDAEFRKDIGSFESKPVAALLAQLFRSRVNYVNYHSNSDLLLAYPISLLFGNIKDDFVDFRWRQKEHFQMNALYFDAANKNIGRSSQALSALVLGAATTQRIDSAKFKTYWELYEHIEHESRDFYPAMLAAAFVFKQFEQINLQAHQTRPKFDFVSLNSRYFLHLTSMSEVLGDKAGVIGKVNQLFFKRSVPANQQFLVPKAMSQNFEILEVEIARKSAYTINKIKTPHALVYYTIKPDDTWNSVAKNFHSDVEKLLKINFLSDTTQGVGLSLFVQVPIKDSTFYAAFDSLSQEEKQEQIKSRKAQFPNWPESHRPAQSSASGQQVYVVKSGDTLGAIARKYRVSVNQLMQWNNLKTTTIQIGQKLVIQ